MLEIGITTDSLDRAVLLQSKGALVDQSWDTVLQVCLLQGTVIHITQFFLFPSVLCLLSCILLAAVGIHTSLA